MANPRPKKAAPAKKRAPRRSAARDDDPTTARRHTGGTPSVDLDEVVDTRQPPPGADGVVPKAVAVTRLDRCLETLRTGGTVADAADRLSVTRETFHLWVRKGEQLAADLLDGRRAASELTDEDRKHVRFATETARALVERKLLLTGLLQRQAQGGFPREVITEKHEPDPANVGAMLMVERKVRVENAEPSERALMFLLERGYREDFGPHVAVTGKDGGPVQIEDVSNVDKLIAMLQAKAEQHATTQQLIADALARVSPQQQEPAVVRNGHNGT